MTVKELINKLDKIEDKQKVVLLYDGYGWANIDKIIEEECTVLLQVEQNPLFNNN